MIAWLFLCVVAWAVPTVAIADLTNETGDASLDGAGPGVAGILVSRFQQTDAVRVIERDALVQILNEQRLTLTGLTEASTAARAGRLVGAEYLVVGEIFSAKLPAVSVALRVVDTESGEVVVSRDVVGEVGDKGERFFTLVDQLSDRILEAMEVELDASERLSEIEQRELKQVLRFGEDLLRVNNDHPMALYRQTDQDFSRDRFSRLSWNVYDRQGERVLMPEFSRRVGDSEGTVAYMSNFRRMRRRQRVANALTLAYGLAGIGLSLYGSTAPPERGGGAGLQITGGLMLAVSVLQVPVNIGYQLQRRRIARRVAQHYEPVEADRWIAKHNRSLE